MADLLRCLVLVSFGLLVLKPVASASELSTRASFAPRMHRFGSADGLPSNRIWAIVQDRAGYLWVATDRGLVVYNGRHFEHPRNAGKLPELAVESLYLDTRDQIWLGSSDRGVCVIAADRRRHSCFATTQPGNRKLPGDTVFAITELAGSIFVGVFGFGIVQIDPESWATGTKWALDRNDFVAGASTRGRALFANYSGGILEIIGNNNFKLSEIPWTGKLITMTAGEHKIWLGKGGGLGVEEIQWRNSNWSSLPKLAVPEAVLSVELHRGRLIAGSKLGLTLANPEPFTLSATFGLSDGLPEGAITALLSDQDGGLWVGSDGDGLAYWSASEQERDWLVRGSPGLPTALIQHAVAAAQGGYWLATQNRGLLRVDQHGLLSDVPIAKDSAVALPTSSTRVLLEQESAGSTIVWVGHQLGLSAYDTRTKRVSHWQSERDSKLVDLLSADPTQGVWAVSGRDLLVHLDPQMQVLGQFGRAQTGGELEQIEWLNGQLWLAGEGGLRAFSVDSTELTLRSQPIKETVYAFAPCPDGLWVATASHLHRLDAKNLAVLESIRRPKSLPTDIGGMRCSATGTLWFAGPGGLWYGDGQPKALKRVHFPGASVEFVDRPFTTDGTSVLIGSQSGLLRQRLETPPSESAYPVHLLLDGKPAPREVLELPWRNPTLELQLDALNYSAAPMQFRFSVIPGPQVPFSPNPMVSLASLAPGDYHLQATARSEFGTERVAAPLHFVVPAPPWQRWYVQLTALLSLLGLSIWLSALFLRARSAKRLQLQRIEHAEQLDQARLESLAFISHEMRNVLNGITANAELLRQCQTPSGQEKYRERILDSGVALTQLLDDALDQSKLQLNRLVLNPQNFALQELLYALAEEFQPKARARGLEWQAELAIPERCYADALRLRQITINLLSNAIKFTAKGQVRLFANWQSDQLELRVQDSGPGITPERKAELFAPFARLDRREQGSGLGLALSFQLARAMGGSLAHNANFHPGCEFVLQVPMPLANEATAPIKAIENQPAPPSLRVLIVEDQQENRELLSELLRSVGHEVSAVADAFAALAISSAERFDAVLIDLDLGGLSGCELAPLLAAQPNFASAALIAISGRVEPADRAASRAAGMVAHLAKPYQLSQIQQSLLAHCSRRDGSAQ